MTILSPHLQRTEKLEPMPALIRKLVVSTTVDGLILQPVSQREQRTHPGLQIRYTRQGSATLVSAPNDDLKKSATLEIYGVVGCWP